MKSVFIIGNGFNCFFSAYLNNPLYKEEIMEKLYDAFPNKWLSTIWYKETKRLLNEYCHLLDDIKIADASVNGEFLLSRLANLCSKVEAEEILEQLEKAISDKIKMNMQNLISDNEKTSVPKTMRTISKLKHTDKNSFNKMNCFSGCLFREMQETGYERVTCYTTNYDKITNEFFDIKDNGITIDMEIMKRRKLYVVRLKTRSIKWIRIYWNSLKQISWRRILLCCSAWGCFRIRIC